MDQVRTTLAQKLAPPGRTGRRRWGRDFNDQVLDRGCVAGLLRTRKLLRPLKFADILASPTAAQARNAINETIESAPYTSKTSASIPPP